MVAKGCPKNRFMVTPSSAASPTFYVEFPQKETPFPDYPLSGIIVGRRLWLNAVPDEPAR
jgi:hypothetical protein